MDLNDLLLRKGIDPHEVIVFRHRPSEPELNKVLPLLAADKPDLVNAYQQTHGRKVEKSLTKASYVASFVAHGGRKALFVGLYKIGKTKPLTHAQFWRVPAYVELKKWG
jgi:phosphoribosylamine-glycine ligase